MPCCDSRLDENVPNYLVPQIGSVQCRQRRFGCFIQHFE